MLCVKLSFIYLYSAGPMSWVQRQMQLGVDPRDVLAKLGNLSNHIPITLDDTTLWKVRIK